MATTLQDLQRVRHSILEAAARRGARRVRVFGSIPRGDATDSSDVDLLVEFEPGRSLLDQVHSRSDEFRLDDIYEAAAKPAVRIGGTDYETWLGDEDLRLVTERLVEIIGEAARAMSSEGRAAHPAGSAVAHRSSRHTPDRRRAPKRPFDRRRTDGQTDS